MKPDVSSWKPGLRAARAAVREAEQTILFLHLAKTGGTSVGFATRNSKDWVSIKFPSAHAKSGKVCVCGGDGCNQESTDMDKVRASPTLVADGKSLFIRTGHSRYQSVSWLGNQISSRDTSPTMLTTVRPARERIVSMFRDYWEQVGRGELYASGEAVARTQHVKNVALNYLADSAHYRDESGAINGVDWFNAFTLTRGGLFFLLDDVFDRQPELLETALSTGRLLPVPTRELDGYLRNLSGSEPVRRRVSSEPSPAITAAIHDARDLIDELAAIDRPYDLLLREHLGADRFPPARAT